MEAKCSQLQKDSDFMTISIQQAFHLELIKLPTQVKNMSLARFREEFGDSLEAVTRSAIGGNRNLKGNTFGGSNPAPFGSAVKGQSQSSKVFQTPVGNQRPANQIISTVMRNPKEGEKLLSLNGSPLGDFQTVVKASKGPGTMIVPPTPGVFIPLDSGDIIDMENMDVSALSKDHKEDALIKMQMMMDSIQNCMAKLKK